MFCIFFFNDTATTEIYTLFPTRRSSDLLALVFLIVYVGAVAVLFLFIVMMLNIKMAELSRDGRAHV